MMAAAVGTHISGNEKNATATSVASAASCCPSSSSSSSSSTTRPFDELIEALKKQKADISKIRMKGRKLYTARAICKDEAILRIPLSCCLTSEMGKHCKMGRLVLEKKIQLNDEFKDQVFLTLLYLEDKEKKTTFFTPYYKVLPTNEEKYDYPLFWPQCFRTWLYGSSMCGLIEGIHEYIKDEYENLCRISSDFRKHTYEEYAWARMIVSSRAFRLTVKGQEVRAFGPLVDMMDHAEQRRTDWGYDEASDSLTVTALEAIPEGTEVQCHYGKKSTKSFVLYYGFAPSESLSGAYPHLNEVQFVMFLHSEFPYFAEKKRLVSKSYICRKYNVNISMEDPKTHEALSFMRLLVAEGESELKNLPNMGPDFSLIDNPIHPLTLRNEIEMLDMLRSMMKEQLSSYTMSRRKSKDYDIDEDGDEGDEDRNEDENGDWSDDQKSRGSQESEESKVPDNRSLSMNESGCSLRDSKPMRGEGQIGVKRKRQMDKSEDSSTQISKEARKEVLIAVQEQKIPGLGRDNVKSAWNQCRTIIESEKTVCKHYISFVEEVIPILYLMEQSEKAALDVDDSDFTGMDTQEINEIIFTELESLSDTAREHVQRVRFWITERSKEKSQINSESTPSNPMALRF
mmetsp:Transcript_2594/g.5933  ORF Transcript_2594/g.5933 Transcript_2594/m.5933 type:complete len:627 (-) Transcript_2594:42-1922(-)